MNHAMLKILNLCAELDEQAEQLYQYCANASDVPEMKAFWEQMSSEESDHVSIWNKLAKLAELGLIPQIFDNPEEVKHDLAAMLEQISTSHVLGSEKLKPSQMFHYAFRLELQMLHPAFITLFQFYENILEEKSPERDYTIHVGRLLNALRQYGQDEPELKIFADTLQRIYRDNKKLALQSKVDGVTGALNRRGLFDSITTFAYFAQRNKNHLGVMLLEIDDYNALAQTQGAREVNKKLQSLVKLLQEDVRKSDLIGRYEDGKFMIFLPQVEPSAMVNIAEAVQRRIKTEIPSEDPLTVSFGLAHGQIDGQVIEQLHEIIKKAENALAQAAKKGENQILQAD